MVSVTGTFKVSGEVVAFTPDRNAPSTVPSTVLVTSFAQFPGVPPHLLVTPGVTVTAEYDPTSRTLALPVARWLERDLLDSYPDGTVTLGLVRAVARQQATVYVHPSVPIVMHREDFSSNARDVLDHLLTDGDVISVRIVRGPNGKVKLRAFDINDDEPVLLAPELYPGTGPWLTAMEISTVDEIRERYLEEKRKVDETTQAMAKLADQFDTDIEQLRELLAGIGSNTGEIPLPSAGQTDKQKITNAVSEMATAHITRVINNYKRENAEFLRANKEMAATIDDMAQAIAELRSELSVTRQRAQDAEKKLGNEKQSEGMSDRRSHFATATEWIREEMRRFWIDTYTPSDRARFRLDDSAFDVLDSFAETFENLDDGEMTKAIRIAVHVVTGRNTEENISEMHDLREGDSVSAPPVTRESDGAVCRRVYVESHTAQARRMHFWKQRDGRIQLSRVAQHDDFTP